MGGVKDLYDVGKEALVGLTAVKLELEHVQKAREEFERRVDRDVSRIEERCQRLEDRLNERLTALEAKVGAISAQVEGALAKAMSVVFDKHLKDGERVSMKAGGSLDFRTGRDDGDSDTDA